MRFIRRVMSLTRSTQSNDDTERERFIEALLRIETSLIVISNRSPSYKRTLALDRIMSAAHKKEQLK